MIKFEKDHEDKLNLHFFAVTPKSPGGLQTLIDLFHEKCEGYSWNTPTPKPFRNVLITPIVVGPQSTFLPHVRNLKDNGTIDRIIFDSGGFSLMTGTLKKRKIYTIDDLIERDKILYEENVNHVEGFMMLDDPPTLADSYAQMQKKIDDTIRVTLEFFHQMSPEVQKKSIPIYHCRHLHQVEKFTKSYQPIIDASGFVSYSAASCTLPSASRSLDGRIVTILSHLVKELKNVHCLGIVSPLAVFLFAKLGIRTYDGTSAAISAGNGEVFLPYLSSVPMTRHKLKVHKTPTLREFEQLKEYTGHHCPFCNDMNDLIEHNNHRVMHNLIVQDQLSYIYRDLDIDKFISVQGNQKYVSIIRNLLTAKDQLMLF